MNATGTANSAASRAAEVFKRDIGHSVLPAVALDNGNGGNRAPACAYRPTFETRIGSHQVRAFHAEPSHDETENVGV